MQVNKNHHAELRRFLPIFLAIVLCTLFFGCESVFPRSDISVDEMERIYLTNHADFNAVQKQINQLYIDELSVVSHVRTIRIARPDADKTTDGTTTEPLIITADEVSMNEDQREALLKAAEPLFEQPSIVHIFANGNEVYFYYYQEWGYEHFVAYREDGRIPCGSFGTIEDSRQIDLNWYSVIAHD